MLDLLNFLVMKLKLSCILLWSQRFRWNTSEPSSFYISNSFPKLFDPVPKISAQPIIPGPPCTVYWQGPAQNVLFLYIHRSLNAHPSLTLKQIHRIIHKVYRIIHKIYQGYIPCPDRTPDLLLHTVAGSLHLQTYAGTDVYRWKTWQKRTFIWVCTAYVFLSF